MKRDAPTLPSAIAMVFAREMRRVQAQWTAVVMSTLEPELPSGVRLDNALSSYLELAIIELKHRAFGFFSLRRLDPLLHAIGTKVLEHVRREVARVLGVKVEPGNNLAALDAFKRQCIATLQAGAIADLDRARVILSEHEPGSTDSDVLAAVLREHFKRAEDRMPVFAQDQTFLLASIIAQERMMAMGITHYTWITRRDNRVRHAHRVLNGKRFAFFAPPIVSDKGDHANPGQFFRCRCKAAPVIVRSRHY